MCKKNAKGLRPFKGPNQKTFGTIGTISAKRTPRAFDLSKDRTKKPSALKLCKKNAKGIRLLRQTEPKDLRHKTKRKNPSERSKHGCQKGGRHFFHPTPRHQPLDPQETKRTKSPEDNSAQERGKTFFQKYKIYACCLEGKQIVYQGSTKENSPFYINCLRATTR